MTRVTNRTQNYFATLHAMNDNFENRVRFNAYVKLLTALLLKPKAAIPSQREFEMINHPKIRQALGKQIMSEIKSAKTRKEKMKIYNTAMNPTTALGSIFYRVRLPIPETVLPKLEKTPLIVKIERSIPTDIAA